MGVLRAAPPPTVCVYMVVVRGWGGAPPAAWEMPDGPAPTSNIDDKINVNGFQITIYGRQAATRREGLDQPYSNISNTFSGQDFSNHYMNIIFTSNDLFGSRVLI